MGYNMGSNMGCNMGYNIMIKPDLLDIIYHDKPS